ncbi:MAG: DUF996 domain-containing protein [Nitrososphaerota archaeon]|nr:DUF996 domain-containing protein [Nitrososphaerota archaeon]
MDFKTSKNLGCIGALLMFIGVIASVSFRVLLTGMVAFVIAEIVGFIFVLISLNGFASFYKEKGIFNNALFGGVAAITGGIIVIVVTVVAVFASLTVVLYQIFPDWNGDFSSLQNLAPSIANMDFSMLKPFVIGVALVLVALYIFVIIAAILMSLSLNKLSKRSGTSLFATASMIMLVGAVIPIIGLLFIWISLLILTIAFFTMKEPKPIPPTYTTTTTPPPPPPPYV